MVEYIPQEKSDTNFAKTMVRPKPNQTPLSDSADKIKGCLENQPDLRAIFKEPTYEELKVALERYLDPDSKATVSAPVAKDEPKSVTATKSATTQKSTSVKDMIDEFDEVFN